MADLSVTLSEIEVKIRKLIVAKNLLVNENRELIQKNEELTVELEALRSANVELRDKLNKIVIVNALGNEKEIEESRQVIKALVKEIDQCIKILNAEQEET
ncbi:MAG TPA: hypothetical protein IAD13_00355 [Bacteroidetes bacterium]|nr:hypothetical protein [Candidatus Limimorpha avicola]